MEEQEQKDNIQTAIPDLDNYSNKEIAQMAFRKLLNHLISRKTIAWLMVAIFTIVAFIMDSPFFDTIFTYGFIPSTITYIGSDVLETGVNQISNRQRGGRFGGGIQGE